MVTDSSIRSEEKSSYESRRWRWKIIDMEMIIAISSLHILCAFAPSTFSWPAFRVAAVLVIITGSGITLSYHRNLAHKSFSFPKWLEYLYAYCGALAVQRDPIFWVSIHRYHHQHVDSAKDPHSPIEGLWFSYMGWLFNSEHLVKKLQDRSNVEDLKKQAFYVFLKETYKFHILASGLLLYALGGFPYLVWGMGVRTVLVYHMAFLISAANHAWGKKVWNTNDLSTNNWWVTMLTFGEGWHNNHHAFEFSAKHGLEWWQIDVTWYVYVIWVFQLLGLATDVKLPTEAHKLKKSLSNFTYKNN